jgi:hypothetical protein
VENEDSENEEGLSEDFLYDLENNSLMPQESTLTVQSISKESRGKKAVKPGAVSVIPSQSRQKSSLLKKSNASKKKTTRSASSSMDGMIGLSDVENEDSENEEGLSEDFLYDLENNSLMPQESTLTVQSITKESPGKKAISPGAVSVLSSQRSQNSSLLAKSNASEKKNFSIVSSDKTAHRMKSRTNRRRNRRNIDSDDDEDGCDDDVVTLLADEKTKSVTSKASLSSYDSVTRREKSTTNRRRNRRDFDSDDDDDDDDLFDQSFDDENRTRRSQGESTRATINSELYSSVGAVAVSSTSVQPQRPAVLTLPTAQELQQQEEEELESQYNPSIDAVVHVDEEEAITKPADRSIPLGNDASSNNLQNDDETFIDATAENIVLPEAAVGAIGMAGVGGKKKPDDINVFKDEEEEKAVDLPWYWSPYLWAMVAALIVALVTIGAVVGVLRGKQPDPVPSPPPTIAPTAAPIYDPIKVGAFERHIGGKGSVKWQDPSTPQNKAYQWLMSEDETTRFYENMREEEIGIMKTRYALAVFYYALDGEKWVKSNDWLNIRMDHCEWQFVDCRTVGQGNAVADTEFKPVTGLQIERNNLYGSLPNELGHLSKLGM